MATPAAARLAYIDWMRGLACVLMFQTHCYDSWLSPSARQTSFFMWSQLGGTLPAPLFLFLAGISFSLVTDKLHQRGLAPDQIARTTLRRGAEIFGLGLLFRLQQFAFGLPWAPWTDLLRVDILNTIGLSMVLMGVLCWLVGRFRGAAGGWRAANAAAAIAAALAIALLTPPLWTTGRPSWLPWPLESYINGVHTFSAPRGWFFPLFPWAGFAFAGLAVGFALWSDWMRRRTLAGVALLSAVGIALIASARWLDHQPRQFYSVYDYWHTSPNFFLLRVGILLVIVLVSYAWCRWGAPRWIFSPMIQLGQTSLLVYWVHIEFVYGRFSLFPKRALSVGEASGGLLAIFLAMLLLSLVRTHFKGRGSELLQQFRRPRPAVVGR
jgi:uncharacterized membrane protein